MNDWAGTDDRIPEYMVDDSFSSIGESNRSSVSGGCDMQDHLGDF